MEGVKKNGTLRHVYVKMRVSHEISGGFVNSKKMFFIFLACFISAGSGCSTTDPSSSQAVSTAIPSVAPAASVPEAPVTPPVVTKSVPVSPSPVATPQEVLLAVKNVPTEAESPGHWYDSWYQGAAGYDQAAEEYEKTNQPMLVYVNVGWCPYCRRFEKNILSSPLVKDFLKDKIKVSINPEDGPRENRIAQRYGVRGYPSVFLHPPKPASAVQLYTGLTPEEFIESFQQFLE